MVMRKSVNFTRVLLLLLSMGVLRQACTQAVSTSAPYKSFGPITDYNTALRNSSDSNHARRGARYNVNNSEVPELGESSAENLFELPPSHISTSVSAADCDTIIVGTVADGQAYLSNDRRNVYSEFKITVQDVIKASTTALLVGQSIDVERNGGAVRLPSGKILQRGSLRESMPQVGKRYLLLLQYEEDTNSFVLKTGYHLEGAHVYCLDEQEKRNMTLNHPLKEYGVTENQLIEQFRKSVSADKRGN